MSPGELVLILVVALACAFGADRIGKYKGYGWGFPMGLLLGVIGVIIMACLPRTEEAKVAAAQKQYEIQAEAARRAGYGYPAQQPYAPYATPGQGPYPQQPGQWQQPPVPGSWEQAPPGQWPGSAAMTRARSAQSPNISWQGTK